MKIHIVQQGDTLWKLAKKYDVDFEQLKAVNNHLSNPDLIMPGMKIKIPTGGVPVKKQAFKKEEQIKFSVPKEMPIIKEVPKEMPIVKETPMAPLKEEVKLPVAPPSVAPLPVAPSIAPPVMQPIQLQPIQMPVTQQYLHHHHMNMNLNLYKPMPAPPVPPVAPPVKMPALPKVPEIKEIPKLEKPIQKPAPPLPPKKEVVPPVMPIQEQPINVAPPPQQCFPVTGIMPGCAPMAPLGCSPYPGIAPITPYGCYPSYPQIAPGNYVMPSMTGIPTMAPQMPIYPQVSQQLPIYPATPYGLPAPTTTQSFDQATGPQIPGEAMVVPQGQQPWGIPSTHGLYGDITMQQPITPQTQPWGYNPQPVYPQFHPYQCQFRLDEEESTED